LLFLSRPAARVAWTVGLVALSFYVAWSIRRTLFVFLLAILFAYMVRPLVRWVDRRTPTHVARSVATATVFALLLAVLVGVVAWIGPAVVEQATRLADQLPQLASGDSLLAQLPLPAWLAPYADRVLETVRAQLRSGTTEFAVPVAREVARSLLVVAGNLLYVIVVPILAFLFISEGESIRTGYMRWADRQRHAPMWRAIADDVDLLLGHYMRALFILALITVCVYGTTFTIAGVPYGLLLAVGAGALEFVPVLGPLLAVVAVLGVALASGFEHPWLLLGFFALYRLFQDYVVNPRLMSHGVAIAPLWVLFGLLAGEELGGIAGIFMSVPLLAAVKILVVRAGEARRGEPPSAVSPTSSEATAAQQQPELQTLR
jgi:predicted PurR-regulated permease PerM